MTINRPGAWRLKSSSHPAFKSQITACTICHLQTGVSRTIPKSITESLQRRPIVQQRQP